MSDQFWTPELQSQLKQARENSGISIEELAIHCSISKAQLMQLEEGGDCRFYSRKIKYSAGIKANSTLHKLIENQKSQLKGMPPPATLQNESPESFMDSPHQRLERVAKILATDSNNKNQIKQLEIDQRTKEYWLGTIFIACLTLFLYFEYDSIFQKIISNQ